MLRITLIRHATLLVELAGSTLLVDPMFAAAGSAPPVPESTNERRNPLVPLPGDPAAIVGRADAALVTHTHVDHLDAPAAAALSDARLPVICQPPDEAGLRERGLEDVLPIHTAGRWRGIEIARTDGRHGTGRLAELLAPVSGFVLTAGPHRLYIAGDTVWCDEVRDALQAHDPTVVVVNAGEARLRRGDPITMDAADVVTAAERARGDVVAVHMEAINHCLLTRAALGRAVDEAGVDVRIPADGETLSWAES